MQNVHSGVVTAYRLSVEFADLKSQSSQLDADVYGEITKNE